MEAQTAEPPSGSVPSSAAYPRRRGVMLERCGHINFGNSCSAADAKTLAAARTSIGHLIEFSLHLAEPLAASRVSIQAPGDGADADAVEYTWMVVAAHGDSLLIYVEEDTDESSAIDYFVYNAGDAATDPPRPPSLSLLPPCHIFYPTAGEQKRQQEPVRCDLHSYATGLLRRGKCELVVAELTTVKVEDTNATTERKVAELCLFRSGEWSVMRPPISYDGEVRQLPSLWNTVVPVGDRHLCWAQLPRDVVICDLFEESPRLQYLQLPMDPCLRHPSDWNWDVCTVAGGGTLKFVSIFPRCCGGGAGASKCEPSRHAYTIHTWTLKMDDGGMGMDMEWVKDGIVDASELWALDAYRGIPRVPLERPVMSMDEHEPHVVYFQLCERHHRKYGGDRTLWLLKIDTRSKTIRPVSRRENGCFSHKQHNLIPSNVLHFFNSAYPSDDASDGALTGQRQGGIERQPVVVVVDDDDDDDEQLVREDDASNPTLQPSSSFAEPSEQATEFF